MKYFLNFLKHSKIKSILLILGLLLIYIYLNAFSYVKATTSNLKDNIFRLHVIANSDSKEDQNLKYKVRDNLLEYMNNLCSNCTNKDEAIKLARENEESFKMIALKTIRENGFSYDVNIEIGNFSFPTKTYGDVNLPAGNYDALKVEIGEANGQNWWCVMFPPLCFVDVTSGIVPEDSKEILKENLSDENFKLISNTDDKEVNFKFKVVELFSKM